MCLTTVIPAKAGIQRSAIERQFEIIGESTRMLANDDQSTAEKITGYRTIIGLRNRIAREYDNIPVGRLCRHSTKQPRPENS